MTSDGDRLIFPVQRQQKHLRTAGWSAVPTGQYGLNEYLCALGERYLAASLTPPSISVLSLSINPSSSTERAALFEVLAGHKNDQPVLDSLMQQIHTGILGLSGYYYDRYSAPITLDVMLSWGVLASGATWPEGFAPLDTAFSKLQYTKNQFLNREYPVDFVDRFTVAGFPVVQAAVPVPGETVVTNYQSSSTELKQTGYQTNQKITGGLIDPVRRWCQTGFYVPCNLLS